MGCNVSTTSVPKQDQINRPVKKETTKQTSHTQEANQEDRYLTPQNHTDNTAESKQDKRPLSIQEINADPDHRDNTSENQVEIVDQKQQGTADNMMSIAPKQKVFEEEDPGEQDEQADPQDAANNDDANGDDDEKEEEPTEEATKKEPLTRESIFEKIKMHHEKIAALDEKIDANGGYVKTVRLAIQYFSNTYFAFRKIRGRTLADVISGRKEAAKMYVDLNLLDLMAEVYRAHSKMDWRDENGKKNLPVFGPVANAALTMVNFSDASDDFAIALSQVPGHLEFMKEYLVTNHQPYLDKTIKSLERLQVEQNIGMVHNMAMRDSTMQRLRQLHFTEVMQPYLKSDKEKTPVVALASLAGIIDERESEIINTNTETVQVLFKWLTKGMASKLRRHKGWSPAETAHTIGKLAMNDANKKLLVELGALELLVQLARTGSDKEQYESIQAIWALTFDEDNRIKICSDSNLGVVDVLVDLKASENKGIVKGCNGALWNLRETLEASPVEKYRQIGEEQRMPLKKPATKKTKSEGHIMISYQWADQEMLKRVRDGLKAAGYQVWMDIDQMGGSTLQAMAEAVENARIVLISMSLKYKNSPNCRAEAEYAYQKQKKIIPLKLERGYIPDGWLGFMAGTKLFFEFSDKYPFDAKLSGLLKEIQCYDETEEHVTAEASTMVGSTSSKPVAAVRHAPVASVPAAVKVSMTSVRQWSDNDVQNWINKNDLKTCNLGSITGLEIAVLMKMQVDAPEFFYKTLQETLRLKSLLQLSKMVWALNELQTETVNN